MKKSKILASILIIVMCCCLLLVLAACPPLPEYKGVPISGVILNGESELELKSVDYHFDVIDYPNKAYTNTDSSVAATYIIQNNSSDDVIAPLYMTIDGPFYEYSDGFVAVAENYKHYSFATDAAHETVLRCFYSDSYYYRYDNAAKVEMCLEKLHDEKQTDVYYNSELPIYKYTFEISDLSYAHGVSMLLFESDASHYQKIFFDKTCSFRSSIFGNGGTDCYVDLDDSKTVTFYSIGMELNGIEKSVKFCNGAENEIENGGKITAVSSEVVTFDDLAMTYYYNECNLSATDWYNAVLAKVSNGWRYNVGLDFFDISDELYYMYQCNLTVPAQSEVNLTVQMPLYPTINDYGYTKDVYEYELDTSVLSSWNGNPSVSVSIVTSGYCVYCSVDLDTTATGFEIKNLESTVKKLTFTLSNDPNVESKQAAKEKEQRKVTIIGFSIIGVCLAVPITAVAIVVGCDNAKRKKERAAKADDTTTTI